MAAAVDWLVVGGPAEPWLDLGLMSAAADEAGRRSIPLFGTGVEVDIAGRPGLHRLVLSGVDPQVTSIDGVPVEVRAAASPWLAVHPCGARSVDHVVITTDDLARTCGAIADATGAVLKRVREHGTLRQGFHRVGGLIVEVVEQPPAEGGAAGVAALWGLALVVDDLAQACGRIGAGRVGPPRPAVQPGRTIATVTPAAGLGVPLVLLSPDPR